MNARSDSDNELLAKVATDVAVLIARFDATLPFLATKAEVLAIQLQVQESIAKVQATVDKRISKMQYWLIGTVVTCALGIGALFATMMGQFISHTDALREQIHSDQQSLRSDQQATRQEIGALSVRIDHVLEANAASSAPRQRR